MERHVLFMVHPEGKADPLGPFEACWEVDPESGNDSGRIEIDDGWGVILGDDTPEEIGRRFRATSVDILGQYTGEVVCEVV